MRNLVLHLSVIVIIFFSGCSEDKIETPDFSEDNAMNLLKKLVAFGPRSSGTEANSLQIEFIVKTLKSYGVAVSTQEFKQSTSQGLIKFTNIEAVIPGREEEFIIIGSHFDTKKVPGISFEGANDGASSTAALMELVRTIKKSGVTPPHTLKFVFFDGEECFNEYTQDDGLFGSRYYALRMREQNIIPQCLAVIIIDMIGDKDLNITLPLDSDRNLSEILLRIAGENGYGDYFTYLEGELLDDHTPFKELGIPAINIIDFKFGPGNSFWHTSEDKIANISPKSLKIVGDTVLKLIFCRKFRRNL